MLPFVIITLLEDGEALVPEVDPGTDVEPGTPLLEANGVPTTDTEIRIERRLPKAVLTASKTEKVPA